jgi:hypothetical protein
MMINTECPALNVNKIKYYICEIRADTKLWKFPYSVLTFLKFFSSLVNSPSLHKCVHVWRSSNLNSFPTPEEKKLYYMQQKVNCDYVALKSLNHTPLFNVSLIRWQAAPIYRSVMWWGRTFERDMECIVIKWASTLHSVPKQCWICTWNILGNPCKIFTEQVYN